MVEEDMCAVVRRLHAEDSEAVLELLEFDYALEEISRTLERLTGSSYELHAAVREIVGTSEESLRQIDLAQDHAARLHACTSQLFAAFRMVRDAVKSWNIAEARRPSNKPSHSSGSPPEGS
jgi:hypothetical protein